MLQTVELQVVHKKSKTEMITLNSKGLLFSTFPDPKGIRNSSEDKTKTTALNRPDTDKQIMSPP